MKTLNKISTLIFDMDGVIIDSVALWKQAEKEIFSSVGVQLSDELCEITATMTTTEVTNFWFENQPWKNQSLKEVENRVINRVAALIKEEGKAIKGIKKLIKQLKSKGFKIGLATNSPSLLIPVVLDKLGIERYFDVTLSAEYEVEGKPNPAVYLSVAKKLNSKPETCIAIEDSSSGLLAAKRAGMQTVAVLKNNIDTIHPEIADYKITSYDQIENVLLR